jgi:ankyrin repeat protein
MRWKVVAGGMVVAVMAASAAAAQDAVDAFGSTALHRAVEQGSLDDVRAALAAGGDANAVNRYNVTPLALAVLRDDVTMVRALVGAGADPNTLLGEGEPVLMTAARRGRVDVVEALVEAGADPDLRERFYGQNAVMWAAIEDHGDVIRLLAAHGADLDVRADILEGEPLWRYGKDRRNGINGEALQNFNTNFSQGGLSPLMYAARHGALDAIDALIEAGAEPDAYDPEGYTPLLLAIMNAQYDAAAALIDAGADVNLPTAENDQSPLWALADQRSLLWVYNRPTPRARTATSSLDLARRLLEAGAVVDAPLSGRAIRPMGGGGHALTRNGATPFLRAAAVSDLELMRLLVEYGADPTVTMPSGVNALHLAAGLGWVDNTMSTAVGLGFATEDDSIAAIRMLLDAGLDVNAADREGRTAVHGAASRGANDVLRFLAAQGARLDAVTLPQEIPGNVNDSRVFIEPGRSAVELALLANPVRLETVAVLRELMGEDPAAPLPAIPPARPAE